MSDSWVNPSQDIMTEYDANIMATNPILKNARWTIHRAAEALQPQPELEYLIENIVIRGSVNLFYGEPGSKKTYSLLHMGICVAMGIKWLDFATRKTNVLIVDEESGKVRMNRRLAEIMRGEATDSDLPCQYVSLAGFKLDDPKDAVLFESLIIETSSELVILDSLSDLMDGDENSKQDTQPVFQVLRRIAENTNAAIIVIHHSNKTGGYRGSSAIKGAVDLMVQVTSEDGSDRIDFKTEKTRDSEAIKFSAKAFWEEGRFFMNRMEYEDQAVLGKAQEYVLRYLEEHGPSTVDDIKAGADVCSPNGARSAVYSLAKLERIKRTNPGQSIMTAAIYDLAERST